MPNLKGKLPTIIRQTPWGTQQLVPGRVLSDGHIMVLVTDYRDGKPHGQPHLILLLPEEMKG